MTKNRMLFAYIVFISLLVNSMLRNQVPATGNETSESFQEKKGLRFTCTWLTDYSLDSVVDGNYDIEAVFADVEQYALTILTSVGGTTDPAPGTYMIELGANVTVQAIPEKGYRFSHWLVNGEFYSTANPAVGTMPNGDVQLQPVFELVYVPLEMVISRRMSIHYGEFYNLTTPVPSELISKVLWAAYGYSWRGRTAPSLSGYPVIIYVCNETAAYKFVPENQSLTLLKEGDYRGLGGAYPAPIQLFIAVDTNICENVTWGNAESGCPIQNIYLMANALNLGTVVTDDVWGDINQELGLPENEKVLYKMSLGYPLPPYTYYQNLVPTSRPSSSELPEIQDSTVSLEDALDSVFSSHEWSENPVTKQELSQVLWASYGYSYYEDNATSPPKRHRTVPSAHSYYPMRIYAANSSGVYEYLPEQHTLTTIIAGDRRLSIALASGNSWASSAPLIIALAWDDSHILTVDTTYIEVGLIAQNVYLESTAWGLIADWGKADSDEEAMREALGLTEEYLHPASIITVGHPSITAIREDVNLDLKVDIIDIATVAKAFRTEPGSPRWNPSADVRKDFIINIIDIAAVAKKFGWLG